MDIKEQILVALGLNKATKLSWQAKSEDGTIFVSTADELQAGVDISVLTEDGTTILLPIGTYKTDTGVTFRVETEGVVAEVMETETEEVVTDEEVEMGEDTGTDDDEVKADDWAGMEKRVKNLEDAIADLKAKIGDNSETVEMADEEATEDVVTEVVEEVEKAVEEIAAAIDDATPEEVTPELAAKAAEVAVEVMQEKAEEVAQTEMADEEDEEEKEEEKKKKEDEEKMKKKKKKYSKLSKLEKENKRLKEKLKRTPADTPLNTNKFSSDRPVLSNRDYKRLSSRDKFLYNLNK
jgi:3-methyladenine DNA glycosylase/8-oxoguanine DNA glycosylase